MRNVETAQNKAVPLPAMPAELLEEDRSEAAKKAMAARVKAKLAASGKLALKADLDDAINILTQKITHTRIITMMLTDGRAREALSEGEADELDWMLLYGLQAIEEAADSVAQIVRLAEVQA